LLSGGKRVIIHIEASPLEHRLATTDPRELARRLEEVQTGMQARRFVPQADRQSPGMTGNGYHHPKAPGVQPPRKPGKGKNEPTKETRRKEGTLYDTTNSTS